MGPIHLIQVILYNVTNFPSDFFTTWWCICLFIFGTRKKMIILLRFRIYTDFPSLWSDVDDKALIFFSNKLYALILVIYFSMIFFFWKIFLLSLVYPLIGPKIAILTASTKIRRIRVLTWGSSSRQISKFWFPSWVKAGYWIPLIILATLLS